MMLITFLSYKIKNNLFDYIILLINVLLYLFLPFVNFINYEKTTNCEDYSLLYILGQNFSEKYTHNFFNFYYLGFMIGVFLFYKQIGVNGSIHDELLTPFFCYAARR